MEKLSVVKRQENEKLTVITAGKIDTSNSSDFDAEIKSSLEGIMELVLDFGELKYISSSGLRSLLSLTKIMAAKGGKMTIINPTPMVSEVFRVTGFDNVLNIE